MPSSSNKPITLEDPSSIFNNEFFVEINLALSFNLSKSKNSLPPPRAILIVELTNCSAISSSSYLESI